MKLDDLTNRKYGEESQFLKMLEKGCAAEFEDLKNTLSETPEFHVKVFLYNLMICHTRVEMIRIMHILRQNGEEAILKLFKLNPHFKTASKDDKAGVQLNPTAVRGLIENNLLKPPAVLPPSSCANARDLPSPKPQ